MASAMRRMVNPAKEANLKDDKAHVGVRWPLRIRSSHPRETTVDRQVTLAGSRRMRRRLAYSRRCSQRTTSFQSRRFVTTYNSAFQAQPRLLSGNTVRQRISSIDSANGKLRGGEGRNFPQLAAVQLRGGWCLLLAVYAPFTRPLRSVYARVRSVYAPCTLRVCSVYAPCTLRVRSVYAPCTLLFTSGFVLFTSGFVRFTSGLPAVYIRVSCGLNQACLRGLLVGMGPRGYH